jgi:hypothetical protein
LTTNRPDQVPEKLVAAAAAALIPGPAMRVALRYGVTAELVAAVAATLRDDDGEPLANGEIRVTVTEGRDGEIRVTVTESRGGSGSPAARGEAGAARRQIRPRPGDPVAGRAAG